MSINLNLDKVQAWKGGGMVPPGKYVVRIDDAKEGTSRSGYPQIELEMSVTNNDYDGSKIKDWIVITEKSLGRVRGILEAAGVNIPAGNFQFDCRGLVGRMVSVIVREEIDLEGKQRTRIKAYEPAGVSDLKAAAVPSVSDSDIPF